MRTKIESEIIVRPFKKADLEDAIRVCARALTGPAYEDHWRRYFTKNSYLSPGRLLIAEKDGQVVGTTGILDFHMTLGGKLCPVDGVAAVAVDSFARRQGVADRLVRESIHFSHRNQRPASALYPFRGDFYRRFGYAQVEWTEALQAQPRTLPDSEERSRVRPYRDSDRTGIERVYARASRGTTGLLKRDDVWWDWRVLMEKQERLVYAPSASGPIEGYAICSMVDWEPMGSRHYRVMELIANTPRAYRGLLGWLSSLGDEIGTIEIYRPRDNSLVPFLHNWTSATPPTELYRVNHMGYLGWGMMVRITHLEKALAFRPARGVRGSLTVELTDPVLEANQRPVTVRFDGSKARIARNARGHRVRADIRVFSQIWFGAVAATQARALGQLECNAQAAEMMDRAWYGPTPFLGPLNGF